MCVVVSNWLPKLTGAAVFSALVVCLIGAIASDAHSEGLVPVGTQPNGGLTGKIVYTHGGHGITADNKGNGKWTFQRGEGHEMIEDLGNIDQMNFLVDYLFRAGATIAPLRPVGHQVNEVVMDNDDPGVTFSGQWTDGKESIYFGKSGAVPYKQARTSNKETAYARYTPEIPEAGFYPVYAWTSSGKDRAADQLYRVNHTGGATEVMVNHRRVGNGLVYLGTYYFEAGKKGSVDISNQSNDARSVVVADMIRFGNGKGDIDRGGGVSGFAREDEAGLYWVKWHADRSQGISESDYRATDVDRQATISLSPRHAHFMNREGDGRLKDRVFVSFHSNAGGGGKARGVLGLLNGNNDPTTATPNQMLLAKSLAQKVNDDLVAQDGLFEHKWHDRGDNTTLDRDDIDFGEINNHYIKDEFDATIVEVAFHDSKVDAELMRDPRVRDALARATYQGLLTYFRTVDNNSTPQTRLPAAVTDVRVESSEASMAKVSWEPPAANSYLGDEATGYRVYASTNGYGFDGGQYVKGGKTKSATITGLDSKTPYYFKVVAENEGGESQGSEVVAAMPSGGPKNVLIVNGFDRLDRTMNPKQPYRRAGNTVDRVRPRESNSRDYVVQVASAIETAAPGTHVNSASNEAVIDGAVKLTDYKTVVWILGEESTADHTFDATEQRLVEEFVARGGNLFVSGSNITFDLDEKEGGREFCRKTLCTKYVSDSAGTHQVTGFDGLAFGFGNREQFPDGEHVYDVDSPDVIAPEIGGMYMADYSNSNIPGGSAIQVHPKDGRGAVIVLGFPFETITTPHIRAAVMKYALEFFQAK
jgi:hypothetical protein